MGIIKGCFSIIGTGLVYLVGGYDIGLKCFLIVMILDYITALLKAFKNKNLDSDIGLIGILKKFGMLILIALSSVIDEIMGSAGVVRNIMIYYLMANEGLSIIENLGEYGILVPDALKNSLEHLKDKNK